MTARELVECSVVVGTAGHVDHGKSALIEALTGKNPDRLEVEKRRGMTTELGFGELELPSGKLVGLVDVPGHAHYLRAMVQGATGVDVALLVVSAVEGVMPQTREHVRVLELLGVTHMVVALTMRDLADDETAELAELDVMDFLGDTVFADAPVVPVSLARVRASRTFALPSIPLSTLSWPMPHPARCAPVWPRACPSTAASPSRDPGRSSRARFTMPP